MIRTGLASGFFISVPGFTLLGVVTKRLQLTINLFCPGADLIDLRQHDARQVIRQRRDCLSTWQSSTADDPRILTRRAGEDSPSGVTKPARSGFGFLRPAMLSLW